MVSRLKRWLKKSSHIDIINVMMPLIPFLIVEILFLSVVQYKHEFHLNAPVLWEALFEKILFDAVVFWGGTMALFFVTRSRIVAFLYASFYLLVTLTDSAIYLFGNTLLQRHHLNLISWYSIGGFLSFGLVAIIAVLFLSFFLTWKTVKKMASEPLIYPLLVLISLALIVQLTQVNELMIKRSERHSKHFKDESDKHQHYLLRCHNDQIRYVRQNSLVHFIQEVAQKERPEKYKVMRTTKPFEKTIKKWNLALGTREYAPLNLKKFKRIILFANESLSLDLLAGHNPHIGAENAAFLDAPQQKSRTFDNYHTTSAPTLHGLTVALNSHPNYHAILNGKHFADSLPNILQKQGFTTVFLRGASKFYAKENIIFKNLGYQKIIAREFFEKQKIYDDFIFEWGVSDRIVFNQLIPLLKEHKDDSIFVTVLGINTHPPNGRYESERFSDYPPFPEKLKKLGKPYYFLRAIQQLDYDLQRILERMEAEGLYDEETLVIITADHACPYNSVTRHLKGFPKHNIGRIPLLFLTPAKLPPIRRHILSSQLDFAPTILHLLGEKIPQGYWGDSLFSQRKREQKIGFERKIIFYTDNKTEKRLHHRGKSDFMKLFDTVIYDSK
ncbi:sulfatase-like hydrolase/transferase [bacterium]|nr:sulfatase-like hydrolase/transferase [bacterium]